MINPSEIKFGRLQQFDERSRKFNIAEVLPEKKPRSYTWRCPIVLDQGSTSSCVGNAWAHELAARPKMVQGIDETYAMNVYHIAQDLDEFPGNEDSGTSILAGAKAVMQLGKIKEYRWAFDFDDLIMALGYTGCVVLGINWYEQMNYPDSKGLIRVGGRILGGHGILANKVSIKNEVCGLHQSWGLDYGINGDVVITFADLKRLLSERGEACIPTIRVL